MPVNARGHYEESLDTTSSSNNNTNNNDATSTMDVAEESETISSSTSSSTSSVPTSSTFPTLPIPPEASNANNLSSIGTFVGSNTNTHAEKVSYLSTLGFTKEESGAALTQANEDIELAASLLFLSRG